MADLKPCPFCGSDASSDDVGEGATENWIVICNDTANCGATQGGFKTEDIAIAAWNRRAPQPQAGEPTEAMVEAALHAPLPGGAEVYAHIDRGGRGPSLTARMVMRAALKAALSLRPVGEAVAWCDNVNLRLLLEGKMATVYGAKAEAVETPLYAHPVQALPAEPGVKAPTFADALAIVRKRWGEWDGPYHSAADMLLEDLSALLPDEEGK